MKPGELISRRRLAVALLILSLVGSACERFFSGPRRPPGDWPRLVLLYVPCTVNKNYLSPYNPEVSSTPFLDAFAKRALVFSRHQTEGGSSGISFASIFSGTQASHHRIFAHPTRIRDSVELITEAFADAGYGTHAWLKHPLASPRLNYAQGVDSEHARKDLLEANDPEFRALLERLREDPEESAFIVVNFTVTHGPYPAVLLDRFCELHPSLCTAREDAEEFERLRSLQVDHGLGLSFDFERTRERLGLSDADVARFREVAETLYRASVFHLDTLFGEVVEAIDAAGLRETSLIAFTADHGEVLYRDNALFNWIHEFQLAPEVLGVPLLIAGKGVPSGTYEGVTRSIDVFPTLASLSGVPLAPLPARGRDLSPFFGSGKAPANLVAFSHTALWQKPFWEKWKMYETSFTEHYPDLGPESMWVGVRKGDLVFKLQAPEGKWGRAVFDLASDREERTNLYDAENPEHAKMFEALEAYKRELVEVARDTEELETPNVPQAEDLLRSLGYIQ